MRIGEIVEIEERQPLWLPFFEPVEDPEPAHEPAFEPEPEPVPGARRVPRPQGPDEAAAVVERALERCRGLFERSRAAWQDPVAATAALKGEIQ